MKVSDLKNKSWVLKKILHLLPGYVVGASSLTLLLVSAAILAGGRISYSIVFTIWALPLLAGLIDTTLLKPLIRRPFLEIVDTLQYGWMCAPLLLILLAPLPSALAILKAVAGFLFLACYILVPLLIGLRHTPENQKEGLLLAAFTRAFTVAMLLLLQTCLYHDALWNYGYLRSIVIDFDLDMYNEFILHNSYFMYVPHPNESLFFMGSILPMAPFFLLAHGLTSAFGPMLGAAPDGYTWPYTLITSFSGILASLATCLLVYRMLRRRFEPILSVTVISLIFFSGNLIFYAFTWPLYTHPFSALLVSAFVYYWLTTRDSRSRAQWFAWGLILGLSTWVRPQTVLFGLLPASDLLESAIKRRRLSFVAVVSAGLFASGLLLGFTPQMIAWLRTDGALLVDSYAAIGDDFSWFRPRLAYLLFTTRHGFFSWHPLFLACLPGYVLLFRRSRRTAIPLGLCLLAQLYIISCYEFPEGGAGFGARYMIATTPILALCLAETAQYLSKRIGKRTLSGIGLALIFINLLLLCAYHLEYLPHNARMPGIPHMLRQVFLKAPAGLNAYIYSTHINENAFARPFMSAVSTGSITLLASVVVGSCLAATVVALTVALCRLRVHVIAFVSITLASLAAVSIAICFLNPARPYESIYPVLRAAYDRQEAPSALPYREFMLADDQAVANINIPYTNSFTRVDVVYTTPTRAGETSHAPFSVTAVRVDGTSSLLTGTRPRPVRHWLRSSQGSYHHDDGLLSSYDLGPASRIASLRFQSAAGSAALVVNGVYLLRRADSSETTHEPLIQVLHND